MTIDAPQHDLTGPDGTVRASGPLTAWRVVDLVTTAVVGVAFGVVFLAWNGVYTLAAPLFVAVAPASGLLSGMYLAPAVVGALLIRRPGAALFTELVAAFVEMALGNQWGATVLISGVMQGLGVELVLALVLWRRWSLMVAVAAGIASAVVEIVGYEWWSYYGEQPWSARWAYLGFVVLSGAVVAGLGGYLLVRALAGTGALSAFPAGVEHAERTAS